MTACEHGFQNTQYLIVVGFPSYRVGSDGSVWSCAKGKDWTRLKPTPDKDGYNCIRLYAPSGWKQCRVALLVCTAFHGPCPAGQECRHLNGDNSDDAASNLTWGTSVENKADQILHGTKRQGDNHHNMKLTEAEVARIRAFKGQYKQRNVASPLLSYQVWVSGRKPFYGYPKTVPDTNHVHCNVCISV